MRPPGGLQASHIQQHAVLTGHKVAERAFFKPDEPVSLTLQATAEDDRLLHGAVPQPADWLRAWKAVRNPRSWSAAAVAGLSAAIVTAAAPTLVPALLLAWVAWMVLHPRRIGRLLTLIVPAAALWPPLVLDQVLRDSRSGW